MFAEMRKNAETEEKIRLIMKWLDGALDDAYEDLASKDDDDILSDEWQAIALVALSRMMTRLEEDK